MSTWQLLGYLIVLSLVVLIWIAIILYVIRSNRRKAAFAAMKDVPTDHMSLYVGEYFPTIMRNFALVSKSRYKEWSDLIEGRLDKVSDHISTVKSYRKKVDDRLTKVESRIDRLES